jgi:predicted HTH domain antitoxin
MTTKLTSIEVELPQDIIFAMRGHRGNRKVEDIKEKLKISLAIILFQEGTISLGKAAELTRMSRIKFIELLKKYDLPAYEYTQEDFDMDQQAVAEYLKMTEK